MEVFKLDLLIIKYIFILGIWFRYEVNRLKLIVLVNKRNLEEKI